MAPRRGCPAVGTHGSAQRDAAVLRLAASGSGWLCDRGTVPGRVS